MQSPLPAADLLKYYLEVCHTRYSTGVLFMPLKEDFVVGGRQCLQTLTGPFKTRGLEKIFGRYGTFSKNEQKIHHPPYFEGSSPRNVGHPLSISCLFWISSATRSDTHHQNQFKTRCLLKTRSKSLNTLLQKIKNTEY